MRLKGLIYIVILSAIVYSCNSDSDKLTGVKVYQIEKDYKTFILNIKNTGINTIFTSKEICSNDSFIQLAHKSGINVFVIWPVFYNPEMKLNRDIFPVLTILLFLFASMIRKHL